MDKVFAGFDVSKNDLVLGMQGKVTEWKNTPAGCRKIMKKIGSVSGIHVVCESTGGYEDNLVNACHEAGVPVSVVFPKRVRDFAKSCGQFAKTDPIDALMICRFAEATTPSAQVPPTPAQVELAELEKRRQQVMTDIQRQKQQTEGLKLLGLRQQAKLTIKRLESELAVIQRELKKLAKGSDFKEKVKVLTAEKGIARTSALTILAFAPELGTLNREEITKLGGLAPFNMDSGKMAGKRSIYGGRGELRKALYMPALSASRAKGKLGDYYRSLIAKGKNKMVAITAIMRKLLITLNAIMKNHLEMTKTT